MSESITPTEVDDVSISDPTEPTQLWIDGTSLRSHEIEHAIELALGAKSSDATTRKESGEISGGNSLSLTSVGLNTSLTEDLIRLIRRTKSWDSISLAYFLGDRTLCNDLLLACTTHPSVRSLTWKTRTTDSIRTSTTGILEPTDFPTAHALLYGLKYGSHLTKLDATGLVLDVNTANLLSRALVRNTTLLDLALNGTRFLSVSSGNQNPRSAENHQGTKNMTVQTLSFGLRFNRTIESLSLESCNDLEDEDISCLVNAVNSDGTVLRRLSLQETACFDQGMSSVALLLQENVIENLNLSYLVRRRKKTPELREDKEQGNQQEQEEEQQQDEDEEVNPESVETSSNEEEKDQGEAELASDANVIDRDEDDDKKQEALPSEDANSKQAPNDNKKEQEHQQVRNTSLKVLSMVGNDLDDDYLESLLGIFPPSNYQSTCSKEKPYCSRLEELALFGNRFSNHGIKQILNKLPRFPYLQRLYLGYQRAPPPSGPSALPQAIVSRIIASNPSLSDRNTQFSPGSLRKEFFAAVANPINFRLTNVNIMALTDEDKNLDKLLRYHMRLNAGGRKLLASYARSNANTAVATPSVPLGLWPLVLDRANRLYPCEIKNDCNGKRNVSGAGETNESSSNQDEFDAGDVIFRLLHGPMVFENLDRRSTCYST